MPAIITLPDKEDLLASGIEGLRTFLKGRQRQILSERTDLDERMFAFTHDLFVHADEHRDVFKAMVGKRSGAVVQQLLHKLLVDLSRDEINALVPKKNGVTAPIEASVQFFAGALFGLLMWWGKRENADVSGGGELPISAARDSVAESGAAMRENRPVTLRPVIFACPSLSLGLRKP